MNFLFVAPKYVGAGRPYDFYLGIAYVSSYMKYKNFNVFCLNTNHYDTSVEQQLSEHIAANKIDVICTGGMSYHFNQINTVLEAAKKIKPDIITVVGGAIITSDPVLAMENMKIDYGIIGEGEETMADLADKLCNGGDINSVKGLIFFNKDRELITNEKRPYISDLNSLPVPDYEGFEYGKFVNLFGSNDSTPFTVLDEVKPAYIITSRSCPFNCTFCYHPLGKKYRQRSLDNVFMEIDYLVKMYGINMLYVMDELFAADKKRMHGFAEKIRKYNINWMPQLRVTDVDEHVLKALKDSGVFCISYGIESASDKILESMKKKTTRAQIENALNLTQAARIAIQGNIILGDPEETEETLKESIDWWKEHPEYGINLSMIQTVPDAPIYRYAMANNLIKDKLKHMKEGFPIINLTKISDNKFEEVKSFVKTSRVDGSYVKIGKVLESKIQYKNQLNENIFSIKIRCPICHNISEYKNMKQSSFRIYSTFICRNCYLYMRVENEELYFKNYTILDRIFIRLIKKGSFFVRTNYIVRYVYYNILKKYSDLLFDKYFTRLVYD